MPKTKRKAAAASKSPAKRSLKANNAPPVTSAPGTPMPVTRPPQPCVVGVGASAGGFEATCGLLGAVPPGSNLAFVIVQHLDPGHKSLAAELLARHTRLFVEVACSGTRIEADHVYTIPADRDAVLNDGRLELMPISHPTGSRLPIDRFFCSLGPTFRAKAVGVVLSGTGADGSVGIKAIVANGGIALVQQPETAQFDGMPQSAIATGVVSQVLPVPRIAEALIGYARHPYVVEPTELSPERIESDASIRAILETLRGQRPQNFAGYKSTTLLRRIERRMGLRNIATMAEYARILAANEGELDALAADMLIGITDFFRDPEAWKALTRTVIEPLVSDRQESESIRVWVPGTSTGEEAYTVAILLLESLEAAGKQCAVQVFATDANTRALAVARTGRYPAGIAAQISPQRLKRYFVISTDMRQYQVSAELRGCVVFGPQNLFGDPPLSRVDLITCRNVLIYLDPEAQRRVLSLFHFALRPGSCMMLGTAEHAGDGNGAGVFECISKQWQIYRRLPGPRPATTGFPMQSAKHRAPPREFAAGGPLRRGSLSKSIAQKLVLDHFAPASVLVDEQHQALYFSGKIDRFLSRFSGPPSNDVLAMAGPYRSAVRDALHTAATRRSNVVRRAPRIRKPGDSSAVEITVMPVPATFEHGILYLVVFDDAMGARSAGNRPARAAADHLDLQEDLRTTRAELQRTVEELEGANTELSLSQEDKNTANEELQSINEELESSKEELQSLNEELLTVNQQLRSKVTELETANNDLTNLLKSSDIISICLDRSMCIRWHSPATSRLVKILPGDVGRPIGDFSSELLGSRLIEAAQTVISSLTPAQEEIRSSRGRWFLRRVLPYRINEAEINGVIITFTDITESKAATEKALADRQALLGSLEERVRVRTSQLRSMAFALSVAEERERRAVASDLHDDLGQTLALIKVKLNLLVKHMSGTALEAGMREIIELIDSADERVRSLVFQLSPPVLHELGLLAALAWLADEMRRVYGLTVDLHMEGGPEVADPVVRTIVFRAVRELLINVVRHAKVSVSQVEVRDRDGSVHITVSDGGGGFDVETQLTNTTHTGRFGLMSVRERLEFVGGRLDVRSIPNDGTEATVTVPLRNAAAGEP